MEAAGEWKGREGGGNGGTAVGAAAVRGAAAGVVGNGRLWWRRTGAGATPTRPCSGSGTGRVVIPGSAAPRIRARHCRAKIGGAAEPCHVSGQR